MTYALIVLLPLLGAILAGFFGAWLKDRGAQIVTCGLLVISALLSWLAFVEVIYGDGPVTVVLFYILGITSALEAIIKTALK